MAANLPAVPDTPRLELRRIVRRFSSGDRTLEVLAGVDLTVAPGEMVAILGPSGSGKSTLLALMAGLDRPGAGEILLDGERIDDRGEDELARIRRTGIGFVFQSFQLLQHLTARENVSLPLELLARRNADERAEELLARVGLKDRGHHYPSQLSGGEQQRVALARAFGPRPALLLADEPTGNLDRDTGKRVLSIFRELHDDATSATVVATHDPEVARLADRRLRLHDGRLEPAS
ncbi:MAG: ABC transporter ATP-binding protein [Thermoanaerobaculia bacterium]|nr:ABC transporter ATP-binding protein [Thermoanaerobaculia bacterium]